MFDTDEFIWGTDGRCEAGFGFWQLAYCSRQPFNQANFRAARDAMLDFKADYGRPLGINPGVATVPSGPTENAARDAIFAEKLANGASNTDYKLIDVEMVKWLPRT